MDDGLNRARSEDPGRGAFRATTKNGIPINAPPRRSPVGVSRPGKTHDDSLPVKERQRYKAWLKTQGR